MFLKAATEARQASEPPAAMESVEFSDVEASEMDVDLLAADSGCSEAGPRTSVTPRWSVAMQITPGSTGSHCQQSKLLIFKFPTKLFKYGGKRCLFKAIKPKLGQR